MPGTRCSVRYLPTAGTGLDEPLFGSYSTYVENDQ